MYNLTRPNNPFTYARRGGWWSVNFCRLTQLLSPTFLRKEKMRAWLCLLVSPIQELQNIWLSNRRDNLYNVQHNSQVCYLRKMLNDEFDSTQRRILIDDGLGVEAFYIYTEGENKPKYIRTEAENAPVFLHPSSAYAGTGVDFYVLVPIGLEFNEIKMRALVDFYRLASKRYEIVAS